MRRIISMSILTVAMAGLPALVGCDRTISHNRSVETKENGTTVTKDEKTTKNADGSVTKTQSKDVDKNNTNTNP